jgi:mRNA-degrading endonuclease RelE of RelBE toxin-antitoxin system
MTYKVYPITYTAYQDELPNLTEPQKAKIKAWLIEARENAIDAESSEKKHAWFGKFKGRINNYLSAQGYDMKKEGEEWQKRIKERNMKN